MQSTVSLSRATLFSLLRSVYPNPDDPGDGAGPFGPYGPIGPWIRDHSLVALNPQPLPPLPVRWRFAWTVRAALNQALAQAQWLDALAAAPRGKQSDARAWLKRMIDEWCGTPPRPKGPGIWPIPWPWPFPWPGPWPCPGPGPWDIDPTQLQPVDLLFAAGQFQEAANVAGASLRGELEAMSNQLVEAGMKGLG